MRYPVTAVRDHASLLNDVAPLIRDPQFLYRGRDVPNFPLRPREILCNWLICAVLNDQVEPHAWTFTTDPTGGDGVIVNRATETGSTMEHVFIPNREQTESIEALIVGAIQSKSAIGEAYARGKHLVVFSDLPGGPWHANRVAREISGAHTFEAIWVVALERGDGRYYSYWVTQLGNPASPVWRVSIDLQELNWKVERVQ